ncbi:uncharacterized protein LOC143551146 [Bidens hawaiensis]|uniref:uncharacterized protein LOC143551146 n=1 Tax=Bidens hawaiensis TaxID=980011 RepID=UPI00404A197D
MEATNSETLDHNHHEIEEEDERDRSRKSEKDVLKAAVEVVERDSVAISHSFISLFASLRQALHQATSRSVDHVQCFNDAAGRLQEAALDTATKGNLYINSCLRLNEEMKGIDTLAMRLKVLRRNVDALDTAVNSLVRLH